MGKDSHRLLDRKVKRYAKDTALELIIIGNVSVCGEACLARTGFPEALG